MKQTIFALLILAASGLAQTPSPSFQQYLAEEQIMESRLMAQVIGPVPRPEFGLEFETIANAHLHYPCTAIFFSAQQAENLVDLSVAAGYQVAWINADPGMLLSNSSACQSARAIFSSTVQYAMAQGMKIAMKPSYSGSGTNMWTLCSLVGAAQTPENLATCITTRISTLLLPGGVNCAGGTGCSPVAWFSELATPEYYCTSTEAVSTQNTNLSISGSAADWLSYNNTVAVEVNTHSPSTLLGPALSRLSADVSAHSTFATAIGKNNIGCVSSCHPDFIGYDVYTMDLFNTANGLGANQADWAADQAAGILTLIAESGRPGWNPGGTLQGDAGSYQGNGNCVWNVSGVNARTFSTMDLYFASQGAISINHMAGWTMAYCVYVAPGAGGDHDSDTSYLNGLATAFGTSSVPSQRTPLFCILQNILKWFPVVVPGQPSGIDANCRPN